MYYQPQFLTEKWQEYLSLHNQDPEDVDPDSFVRWTYSQALAHRQPCYAAMSNWGVTVEADEIAKVQSVDDFNALIASALERR